MRVLWFFYGLGVGLFIGAVSLVHAHQPYRTMDMEHRFHAEHCYYGCTTTYR